MVKATLGTQMRTLPTLQRNKDVWQNLTSLLSALYADGFNINWTEYHRSFASCHKVLELPSYGWDLKEYTIPYEGDWCLHRHKIACECADPNGPPNHTGGCNAPKTIAGKPISKPEPAKAPVPTLKSTTVHRIVEETTEPLGATLIVETDISHPDVSRIAQGHTVNQIPLCTPSVYADIAMAAGKYLMNRLRPGYPGIVDVSDMVCDKALVPHGRGPQLLHTSFKVEWAAKAAGATKSAKCVFNSVDVRTCVSPIVDSLDTDSSVGQGQAHDKTCLVYCPIRGQHPARIPQERSIDLSRKDQAPARGCQDWTICEVQQEKRIQADEHRCIFPSRLQASRRLDPR